MWIFLNDGFFSIVEDQNDSDRLVVRARNKDDIPTVFGVKPGRVIETRHRDYRYRIFLDRETVAKVIQEEVMSINYGNFKDSIAKDDKERKNAYTGVWSEMYQYQDELHPDQTPWWEIRYKYSRNRGYYEDDEEYGQHGVLDV